MNSKEDLCNFINQSTITLIGYTFQDEKIKDELISNFNYVEIKEIGSSFTFKSFLREQKINQIIGKYKDFDYILIDLNNIRPDDNNMWERSNFIRNVLEKISERIYIEEFNYKIMITSPVYKSISSGVGNFIGGNKPIYLADLVIVLKENIAKVIKNRNGSDGDYILYNTKQTVEI